MNRTRRIIVNFIFIFIGFVQSLNAQVSSYQSFFVQNDDVKIHCVEKGSGPVILFLHGFPDFWFTWKYQMDAMADEGYRVVAMDLRGYNESDKPEAVERYRMSELISDVVAVIRAQNVSDGVTIVGNDWGGAIAWQVAIYYPGLVKNLIACNIPHPSSLRAVLNEKPETSGYTHDFTAPNAVDIYTPQKLLAIASVSDVEIREFYIEAFEKSRIQSMLDYYKASYPKVKPSSNKKPTTSIPLKKVQCPVLMIHGMQDTVFPPPSLNNHWDYINNNFTLYTIPDAGHFVQRDAPEEVLKVIKNWLSSIQL